MDGRIPDVARGRWWRAALVAVMVAGIGWVPAYFFMHFREVRRRSAAVRKLAGELRPGMHVRELVALASRAPVHAVGYGDHCPDREPGTGPESAPITLSRYSTGRWRISDLLGNSAPQLTGVELDDAASRLRACGDFTLDFRVWLPSFQLDVSLDKDGRVKSLSRLRVYD
jgi:hypothetical protein